MADPEGSERIVEVSAFVAAPLAGMTLASLGCEILRIDPPGGGLDFGRWPLRPDGRSIFWAGLNRGKRSVVVDFRRAEGRELLAELVLAGGARGGVLLTNLGLHGPLAYDALARRRRDVVSVEIEGYPDGSSAVDYTVAARTGVPDLTGPAGHVGPVNSPLPTWDIATGLHAVIAAREAMQRRRSNGEGSRVRVALVDVALSLLGSLGFLDEVRLAEEPRRRDGNYLYGAFGRDFLLGDGSRVMIVAITLKQWRALVTACELADRVRDLEAATGLTLDDEGDRFRARHEVAALVEAWCADRSAPEVATIFAANGVCHGFYGSGAALLADVRRDAAGASTREGDRLLVSDLGFGPRIEGKTAPPLRAAPRLGEHTEEVLADVLGLSQVEISRLLSDGTVALDEGVRSA